MSETKPSKGKPAEPTAIPARRVIVERTGNNSYRVVEETFTGAPSARRVLASNLARVPAEDEVRLWLENFLGPNRFGDSGL